MSRPLAFLTAFAFGLALCWALLPVLRKKKVGQEILQYVTEHSAKQGTPTMGGIAFILATIAAACIFCDLSLRPTVVILAVFFAYGVVGFLDDFIKIKYKHNQGLRAYQKILIQLAIAVLVALYVYGDVSVGDKLRVPFSSVQIKIGFWTVPLVVFIYLACTNGVNLTDGLDGLASCTTICFLAGMAALLKRESIALESVGDTYAYAQTQNVITLCYAAIGALTSFLIFNVNDAKVFMGDTGSLALGALVACSAIFTRMSLFIPVLGLMFVVSCVSVIVQVTYFKLSKGKRVFLMAPYHHHLQKRGLSESRICVIYGAVTVCATMLLLYFGG